MSVDAHWIEVLVTVYENLEHDYARHGVYLNLRQEIFDDTDFLPMPDYETPTGEQLRAALVARAARAIPQCSLCKVPKATGDCNHIIRQDGQIVMSETAWNRLCDEIADILDVAEEAQLSTLEAQGGQ